ncbi:unnamed protein product [Durusdinium trenchii]|uniref:Nuclear pore complex protein Nup85 n=1 Tax=Durusdinium trenchii TaxID=1381693 RepID=A0ABP0MEW9_9DINO
MAGYDQRIAYHAKHFGAHVAPEKVLHRYAQRLEMSPEMGEVQRNAFHVASWLVMLPPEQALVHHGDCSAALLLARHLELMKGAEDLSARLSWVLHRLQEAAFVNEEVDPHWRVLATQLRILFASTAVADDPLQHPVQSTAPAESKSARLMNKAVQIWKNHTDATDQEAYVASLEASLSAGSDAAQIRQVLRRAVAALSPPRLWNGSQNLAGNEEGGMFAYQSLQGRLRKVVLWCLHRLDLADCKAKPALELLESLLQRFQKLLLEGQRQIGGKKQQVRTARGARSTVNMALSCTTADSADPALMERPSACVLLVADVHMERSRRTASHVAGAHTAE